MKLMGLIQEPTIMMNCLESAEFKPGIDNDTPAVMTEWFWAKHLSSNVPKISFIVFGNRQNLEVKIYMLIMCYKLSCKTK